MCANYQDFAYFSSNINKTTGELRHFFSVHYCG